MTNPPTTPLQEYDPEHSRICPYCFERVGKLPPHLPCDGVREKEEFL